MNPGTKYAVAISKLSVETFRNVGSMKTSMLKHYQRCFVSAPHFYRLSIQIWQLPELVLNELTALALAERRANPCKPLNWSVGPRCIMSFMKGIIGTEFPFF